MSQNYQCGNCGRTIGALEQPYEWGEHIICPQCLQLLQPIAQPDPLASLAYAAHSPPAPGRRIQTIEQTGKGWKAQMLLSAMLAMVGTVAAVIGIQGRNPNDPRLAIGGIIAIAVGIGWFIFARIGAWWNHG